MDRCGAAFRSLDAARDGLRDARETLDRLTDDTRLASIEEIGDAFRNHDLLVCQVVCLSAIVDYIGKGGTSRGSYLVCDPDGELPAPGLPGSFRFSCGEDGLADRVQLASLENGTVRIDWEPVRPIPEGDQWFETVWNDFMRDGNVK